MASSSFSQISAPAPFWARIETLWLLVPALITTIFALLQPLAPNDLWYHVRAGEIIAQTGAIPRQNLMSHGVPLETPYFYQSWLSEWLLFQTFKFGGLSGLQLLRALCLALAFALVTLAAFRLALRRDVPAQSAARMASLGAIWGFAMSANNVDLRPQTFSVLLCAAIVFSILEFQARPEKRYGWGAFCVTLVLLWANSHGAFVVALVVLFAFALAHAIQKNDTKPFWLLLSVCFVATLINPRGPELYLYLARLSSDPISQKYIQEWASPSLSDWHSWLFFASLPLLIWSFLRREKLVLPLTLAALFLWVMGTRDARAMIWFALGFAPLFACLFASKKPVLVLPIPLFARFLNAVLLLFLLASPLPLLPHFKANLPWPNEFRERFAPTPARVFPRDPALLLERTTPVESLEYLAKLPPTAAPRRDVFTDMVCGSYLSFAGRDTVLPLCDPRIELFGAAFWEEYVRLSGGPTDASVTLQKRGFRFALLDEETQKPLARRLQNAGWGRVSGGGKTLLLRAPEFEMVSSGAKKPGARNFSRARFVFKRG